MFEEWIRKLDQMLCTKGQKTALCLDNCPEHPSVSSLTNIQLIFLPPNTTSDLQLMDQAPLGTLRPITEDGWFDHCAVHWIKINPIEKFPF